MSYLKKNFPLKRFAIVILLLGLTFLGYANIAAADLLTVNPVFDITGNTYIYPEYHPGPDDPFIESGGFLTVGHVYLSEDSVWSAAALEFLLPIPKSSIESAELYIGFSSSSYPLDFPVHLYGYAGDGTAEFADTEVGGKTFLDSYANASIKYDVTSFLQGLSGDYAGFTLAMTDEPNNTDQVVQYNSLESGSPPTLNIVYTAPVPIPGAVWLLGSGLLRLGFYRRRKMATST